MGHRHVRGNPAEFRNGRGGWTSQSGSSSQISQQYVARLEPGAISQGRVVEHPHFVLGLTPSGWGWFFCMPYYCASPWPQVLITTMEYAAATGDPLEKFWALAVPILDRDHTGQSLADAGGAEIVARYRAAVNDLRELGEDRARLAATQTGVSGTLLYGYDDTLPAGLPAPVLSFIALRLNPGPGDALARALMGRPEVRRAEPDEQLLVNVDTSVFLGQMTPSDDLNDDPYVQPEWVMELGRNIAVISVVDGAAQARARTTPMKRGASQIPGAGMILEVWSTSRPAADMAATGRLSVRFHPDRLLTNDEAVHFGAWDRPFTATSAAENSAAIITETRM